MRLFLILLLTPLVGFCQLESVLKIQSEMPEDFKKSNLKKIEELESLIDFRKYDKNQTSIVHDFVSQSVYSSSSLLKSGKVIYGDAVTEYINKVGNEVLKNFPALKGKVRFYTLKSTETNAVSTYEGIIFVNIGLIARLKSEDELAFILGHEISHYIEEHTLKSFLNRNLLLDLLEKRERTPYLQIFAHSKEQEFTADSLGVIYLSKTKYNTILGAENGFDLLYNADMSMIQEPLRLNELFDKNDFKIPPSYIQDSLVNVERNENYFDKFHSHPNIFKRRERIKNIITALNIKDDKQLIVSDELKKVVELAQMEFVRLQVLEGDYSEALYNILQLKHLYPKETTYLDHCEAKTWYGLVMYKNKDKIGDVVHNVSDQPGYSQNMHYFLKELRANQLNTLALQRTLTFAAHYPEDADFQFYKDQIANVIKTDKKPSPSDYVLSQEEKKNVFKDISYGNEIEKNQARYENADFYKLAFDLKEVGEWDDFVGINQQNIAENVTLDKNKIHLLPTQVHLQGDIVASQQRRRDIFNLLKVSKLDYGKEWVVKTISAEEINETSFAESINYIEFLEELYYHKNVLKPLPNKMAQCIDDNAKYALESHLYYSKRTNLHYGIAYLYNLDTGEANIFEMKPSKKVSDAKFVKFIVKNLSYVQLN